MQSVNDIRSHFLDYFRQNDHEVVASSPLVPQNDPTLMFTNAGMVQFKNLFTGLEKQDYKRAATSQKCVRAGGKHNDLDNVGYTTRHHTFFEMLGNFSFGDYFKERAIELAWNLITKEFGLNPGKLIVTVYQDDDDAFNLWKKIANLHDDRIIRISTSDNFWAMGDLGPCGPCSEIFYDHGPEVAGGPPGSVDQDGDRFVEIWNLVFMQYEQMPENVRINLPQPSIDTGMGLERIAAILQGKSDNYQTDLFQRLISSGVELSNTPAEGTHLISHRVIADHVRSTAFLIADGVMPSNEGRGYVLRRIMRRSMRYAHLMGCKEPLLYKLVKVLVGEMGAAFPELARAEALISETLKSEETRFKQTLARGLKLLGQEAQKLGTDETLPGNIAFQLYDTFGFPLDLTQDALRQEGRSVDVAGFNIAMEKQRQDARKAWAGSGDKVADRLWFDIRQKLGATEFLGYDMDEAEGIICGLVQNGKEVAEGQEKVEITFVTNQTPFYGESGGQMGDSGIIRSLSGAEFIVHDTKKFATDLIVHIGTIVKGVFSLGDPVSLSIDVIKRKALRANHTATHMLHAALRNHLGEHVTQKGSLVAPDRLRFDFSHPTATNTDEREQIEEEVNSKIQENISLMTRLMSPTDAIKTGALALFGEKYGEEVRVVSLEGKRIEKSRGAYSVELCGGTHVQQTGDIGTFIIISESAVSSGVRRIEALTGAAARKYMRIQENYLSEASDTIKSTPDKLALRIKALLDERRNLERELRDFKKRVATADEHNLQNSFEICGVTLVTSLVDDVPARELRPIVDGMKDKTGSGVCMVVTVIEGKVALAVGVTPDLISKISAVDLVRVGAAVVGGQGGGGRPDLAQAGGPDAGKAKLVSGAILDELRKHLTQ